ncbi:ADP-ribosyltransferase [Vibrio campbellii]|uniref:AFP17 n=1 Tax=Vibrio campbellii TaxID=680 RepID=A0A6H0JIK0_9VIBR|nr:ADP-ribosyltransferase [Vibrio campbellii]QIU79712.1 AFP17 [Vibrio campbellii]
MQTTIRTDGAASTAALLSSQQTLSAASTAANTSLSQVSSVSVSLVGNQAPLNTQPVPMPPLRQAEEEFNHAIMRAAQYEGSIENLVRDKVNAQFPTTSDAVKNQIVAQSVEKIAEANQAFEFNHLGNDLLQSPVVEYMSQSFLRRILENVAIAQAKDPSVPVAKKNEDAGIGFLDGWSDDDVKWAEQLNSVLKDPKANARVLTTLAYSHLRVFRDPSRLKMMGDAVNQPLLNAKEANQRLNIFHLHGEGAQPEISTPTTTQPHGWAWLKYADWNTSEVLGNKTGNDFIGSRQNGDPHKGTGFKFQGMQEAMKPAAYHNDAVALKERPEHESGYGGFVINDKTLTTIGDDKPTSVNWRQQNMDKKLPMFAGPSSTTSFMYEVARLLKMPASEAQAFRALLLGWMIQPRDHSFTEIMGALDAYAMEHNDHGAATVDSDGMMAWQARETGNWLGAYEGLITQDIDLPGMEAKTITLNGQEIHLPAIEPVKMSVEEFDQSVTQGKGYPSQYAGSEYLDVLAQAAQSDQEADDTFGLASEKIHYAPQNMNDLKLYNTEQRTMPELPERKPSGLPFIDGVKAEALGNWLEGKSPAQYQQLLSNAASLLAESSQEGSLSNVFRYGERNDVWETFRTVDKSNMLDAQLVLKNKPDHQDALAFLQDVASSKATPAERQQAVLEAIGDDANNQATLINAMLLATTRFYTGNGANIINPGYGDFAPPKNESEMEMRLQSFLKRNQYTSSAERAQAKKEYRQNVDMLQAAIDSPMFERYSGKVWHGCHTSVADAALEKGTGFQFPGFMSTTRAPDVAQSYMAKGALLVINPAPDLGVNIEPISNAEGEREILVPAGTSFTVEQSYTLHLEKGYPPSANTAMKKRIYDAEVAMGSRKPHVTIRITTPEMDKAGLSGQSDPKGEAELADLIDHIKKNPSTMEEQTKVVVLSRESSAPSVNTANADKAATEAFKPMYSGGFV